MTWCINGRYQKQFDMILIEDTSDIRKWNIYTALRIDIFDPTLLHLLAFFPSKIQSNNV